MYEGGRLFCGPSELQLLADRYYPSLVQWSDGRLSIESLRFAKSERPGAPDVVYTREGRDISRLIVHAVSGQQVLHHGLPIPAPIFSDEFDDLNHLFFFPKKGFEIGFLFLYKNRSLVRQLLSGRSVEIPFDEIGPNGESMDPQDVVDALHAAGYREAPAGRVLLSGEFRRHGAMLGILFKRAHFSHNVIGLTPQGDFLFNAFAGRGKEDVGVTVEEAASQLQRQGASEVLIISNGSDVRPLWNGDVQVIAKEAEASDSSSAMIAIVFNPRLTVNQRLRRFWHWILDVSRLSPNRRGLLSKAV